MYEYNGKNVILMLCSKCNIKCKHCYIKYKGDFETEKLDSLFKSIKNKHFIILNGTEPILFSEYYHLYKENNQKRIMTNGLELIRRPELCNILKDNGIEEISLSYHFGIQDNISFVKSNMLDELIEKLNNNGFKIKLMTTISSDNYKNIKKMCKKAFDLHAKTIKFTNYIFQGNAQNQDHNKVLTREQIDYVLDTIDKCRKEYKKEDLIIERCGTFGPNRKRPEKFKCLACKDTVVITPDLNVYQCVFDIDAGNEIGKVINNKIMIYDKYKNVNQNYCKVLKEYNGVDQT